jgi:hypothetical protein
MRNPARAGAAKPPTHPFPGDAQVRLRGEDHGMLIALLAVLGVDLIVIVVVVNHD